MDSVIVVIVVIIMVILTFVIITVVVMIVFAVGLPRERTADGLHQRRDHVVLRGGGSIDWSVAGAKIPAATFMAQAGLPARELAHMLDSLVHVSRRVE